MAPSPVHLRPIVADELEAFVWASAIAFGDHADEQVVADERSVLDLDRTIAALDGDEIVGAASSFRFDLTVPGGVAVPVAGVTNVTVLPTHRRRGILRSMMVRQLDEVAARGEVAAVLNASESAIYHRFGYGLAQEYQTVEIRADRAAFSVPPPERPLRLVPRKRALDVLPELYDRYRRVRPGSLSRTRAWWSLVLGEHERWRGGGKLFVAVADPVVDPATGAADDGGYVIYTLAPLPGDRFRVKVRELLAIDPDVEAALWAFCTSIDLADDVEAAARPLDDPLRWRLVDPRQLRVTAQSDYLWVRLLDVPAALAARAYPVDGRLVLEVVDGFRPAAGGRYRLDVAGRRGTCTATDEPADLALDVADLGSLYLAGVDARSLARAGRLDARTAGAVEQAQALFSWPLRPYCTTYF